MKSLDAKGLVSVLKYTYPFRPYRNTYEGVFRGPFMGPVFYYKFDDLTRIVIVEDEEIEICLERYTGTGRFSMDTLDKMYCFWAGSEDTPSQKVLYKMYLDLDFNWSTFNTRPYLHLEDVNQTAIRLEEIIAVAR